MMETKVLLVAVIDLKRDVKNQLVNQNLFILLEHNVSILRGRLGVKQISVYINELFNDLFERDSTDDGVHDVAAHLSSIYPPDLEKSLFGEVVHFRHFQHNETSPAWSLHLR